MAIFLSLQSEEADVSSTIIQLYESEIMVDEASIASLCGDKKQQLQCSPDSEELFQKLSDSSLSSIATIISRGVYIQPSIVESIIEYSFSTFGTLSRASGNGTIKYPSWPLIALLLLTNNITPETSPILTNYALNPSSFLFLVRLSSITHSQFHPLPFITHLYLSHVSIRDEDIFSDAALSLLLTNADAQQIYSSMPYSSMEQAQKQLSIQLEGNEDESVSEKSLTSPVRREKKRKSKVDAINSSSKSKMTPVPSPLPTARPLTALQVTESIQSLKRKKETVISVSYRTYPTLRHSLVCTSSSRILSSSSAAAPTLKMPPQEFYLRILFSNHVSSSQLTSALLSTPLFHTLVTEPSDDESVKESEKDSKSEKYPEKPLALEVLALLLTQLEGWVRALRLSESSISSRPDIITPERLLSSRTDPNPMIYAVSSLHSLSPPLPHSSAVLSLVSSILDVFSPTLIRQAEFHPLVARMRSSVSAAAISLHFMTDVKGLIGGLVEEKGYSRSKMNEAAFATDATSGLADEKEGKKGEGKEFDFSAVPEAEDYLCVLAMHSLLPAQSATNLMVKYVGPDKENSTAPSSEGASSSSKQQSWTVQSRPFMLPPQQLIESGEWWREKSWCDTVQWASAELKGERMFIRDASASSALTAVTLVRQSDEAIVQTVRKRVMKGQEGSKKSNDGKDNDASGDKEKGNNRNAVLESVIAQIKPSVDLPLVGYDVIEIPF
ncbi:uncharacterized protein MONOS_12508 [Monocercomonoides exilis]|uniref:uncharacterized protein n=1 Tax=Monocercomonoides exilis TaxID=2049356 RepID=UPI003559EDFC|nr:hypothetical protein MONOS_12508 [Monocercomonoides exilis]|eukprot:MONOS_12508.1-p1 / transcript=MONOS_12508.1 / gene=MONOS_12508 / organism=Monocercomonoides_exilis_PA203 / gene_product=unspecified product / transcript_product=unspecified product / location=Mono_scaffold00696:8467-10641(-) / protein_length=725 / sequence_SO=supercontig / SO=protein_coding / is_pseudo=false